MPIPLNAALHYQASFGLRGKSADRVWSQAVREVRSWISQRVEDNTGLGGRWLFTGGRWGKPHRVAVSTQRYPDADEGRGSRTLGAPL